jgi:hypothetical protein
MKRLITSLIIVFLSAFLSVFSLIYLKSIKGSIENKLSLISEEVKNNNPEKATKEADNLYDYYSSLDDILVIFLEHERLEELEETLSRLSPLISSGDFGEFSAEHSKARALVFKLYDHEVPKLKNIL